MTIDASALRPRRGLLAATLGGGLAALASALGRATPVAAADGETVLVGGEYTADR